MGNCDSLKLQNPIDGFLQYGPKMEGHPELNCLGCLVRGPEDEIAVRISEIQVGPRGPVAIFTPKAMRGVQRKALLSYIKLSQNDSEFLGNLLNHLT